MFALTSKLAAVQMSEAVELLAKLDPNSVSCVLMDPPYCSGGFTEAVKTTNPAGSIGTKNARPIYSDAVGTAGYLRLMRRVAVEVARVMRPGGWCFTFCDWRLIPALAPEIESVGLLYRAQIVWDKRSPALGRGFRAQHEMILGHTLGKPRVFSRSVGNVISAKRTRNRNHQTEKPVELIEKLLSVATEPGDVVVDPFMGSGTTGVAAVQMGRRFIGGDIEQLHVDTAVTRLEAASG